MEYKEIIDYIEKHPSFQYAKGVVDGDFEAGKYVKKQCQIFLDDVYDKDCKYFIDIDEVELITQLTKYINFSTGAMVGKPVHDGLAGFQWFFIINALCWKHKDKKIKRRYEKSVLLIARKSGKCFATYIRNGIEKWGNIGGGLK